MSMCPPGIGIKENNKNFVRSKIFRFESIRCCANTIYLEERKKTAFRRLAFRLCSNILILFDVVATLLADRLVSATAFAKRISFQFLLSLQLHYDGN